MSTRTFLALIAALALSSVLSLSIAQGAGGGGSSPGGSITVDGTPPPQTVVGPVAVPQNYTITNTGPTDVQLYVVDAGAAPLPRDWELGDELPEGWTKGARLKSGESTSIGASNGQSIKGLSTNPNGHSDLNWS